MIAMFLIYECSFWWFRVKNKVRKKEGFEGRFRKLLLFQSHLLARRYLNEILLSFLTQIMFTFLCITFIYIEIYCNCIIIVTKISDVEVTVTLTVIAL